MHLWGKAGLRTSRRTTDSFVGEGYCSILPRGCYLFEVGARGRSKEVSSKTGIHSVPGHFSRFQAGETNVGHCHLCQHHQTTAEHHHVASPDVHVLAVGTPFFWRCN